MDKEKKMSRNKKVRLAKFTPEGRNNQQKKLGNRPVYEDSLTSHNRNYKKIKEAANGCWWVEAYLMGNMTFRDTKPSVNEYE